MQRITQRKLLSCTAVVAVGLLFGCGSIGPVAENMDPLMDDFAYEPLAMDPVNRD